MNQNMEQDSTGSYESDTSSQGATLRRGIRLLNLLSMVDGNRTCCGTVGDLARVLDTHKSQISRSLAVLADIGLIERCPEHRGYKLTGALYKLGVRGHHHRLVAAGMEGLEWLARQTGLPTYMVIRSGSNVYPLWSSVPDVRLPFSPPGQEWTLHASAAGTALLMGYDRERFFEELSNERFERFTVHTPTTAVELWAKVMEAKRLGYALQVGEWDLDLGAIAVPVAVNHFEQVSIAVSGAPEDITERVAAVADALTFAAGRLRRKFIALQGLEGAEPDDPRWLSRLSIAEQRRQKNE